MQQKKSRQLQTGSGKHISERLWDRRKVRPWKDTGGEVDDDGIYCCYRKTMALFGKALQLAYSL